MDRHAGVKRARKLHPIAAGLALALAGTMLASCAVYPDNDAASSIATQTFYAAPGFNDGRVWIDGSVYSGFGYGGFATPYAAPYYSPGFHAPYAGALFPLFGPYTAYGFQAFAPYAGYSYFGDPYFASYGVQPLYLHDGAPVGHGHGPLVHGRPHRGHHKDRKRARKHRDDRPVMTSNWAIRTAPTQPRRLQGTSERRGRIPNAPTTRHEFPTWTAASPGHAAPGVLMPASMGIVAVARPSSGGSGASGGPSPALSPARPVASPRPAAPSPSFAPTQATLVPNGNRAPTPPQIRQAPRSSVFGASPRRQGSGPHRRHRR